MDQAVLETLVEERLPGVASALGDASVPLGCVAAPWFICAFATALPWAALLRVWDVLMLERSRTVLFQARTTRKTRSEIHPFPFLVPPPTLALSSRPLFRPLYPRPCQPRWQLVPRARMPKLQAAQQGPHHAPQRPA